MQQDFAQSAMMSQMALDAASPGAGGGMTGGGASSAGSIYGELGLDARKQIRGLDDQFRETLKNYTNIDTLIDNTMAMDMVQALKDNKTLDSVMGMLCFSLKHESFGAPRYMPELEFSIVTMFNTQVESLFSSLSGPS